ncbi:hypothetical protein Pr1d_27580 [Bythopirellula goksoeyrii]|uniref:Uncharacterized protein n=1 Tax=Bythopirellula goksoeyrii TaxID=1400387 RepID=A0A5B9QCD6_9BACT|nr:hypothetical protein Pr1d_27580 [Bythopirellula goksoeyrii]
MKLELKIIPKSSVIFGVPPETFDVQYLLQFKRPSILGNSYT